MRGNVAQILKAILKQSYGDAERISPTAIVKGIGYSPYDFQDAFQELVVHGVPEAGLGNWKKGNNYRYVLEGSGDIFRELSKRFQDTSYINEKLRRINRQLVGELSGEMHPEDTFRYAYENNPEKFARLGELWQSQPTNTPEQLLAKFLNKSLVAGDFEEADDLAKFMNKAFVSTSNPTEVRIATPRFWRL